MYFHLQTIPDLAWQHVTNSDKIMKHLEAGGTEDGLLSLLFTDLGNKG